MDFSKFAKTLYPYIGKNTPRPEYIKSLFESILSEKTKDELNCSKFTKDETNEIANALNKSNETFKKIYKGERGITKIAQTIYPYTDPKSFKAIFDGIDPTKIKALCEEFKEEIPDIEPKNAKLKIGELFVRILKDATFATRKKKSTSKLQEIEITSEVIPSADTTTSISNDESSQATFQQNPYLNFSIENIRNILEQNDLILLDEFISDYDPILEECIQTQYTVTVDIDLGDKIHYMYEDRWIFKSIKFKNKDLRNFVFEIINTLNELLNYISDIYMRVCSGATFDTLIPRKTHRDEGFLVHDILSKETTRIKTHLRILYIALHPGAKDSPAFADLKELFHAAQNSDDTV